MNRQQLLQQMTCLVLTALLLIGCGGMQVEPTSTPIPIPATQTPTARSHVPPTPAPTLLMSTPLTRQLVLSGFVTPLTSRY